MTEGEAEPGVSPYASGGGGTVLEQLYGAILLSSLLVGDPVTELGDDTTAVSVRFQGRSLSPVDDLIVSRSARDGQERRAAIGVRRAPDLTSSDTKTLACWPDTSGWWPSGGTTSPRGDGGCTSRSRLRARP